MMSLMPDVTELLVDPDLGAQRFTIIRENLTWMEGKTVPVPEQILAVGIIQPATEEQINQVPEGDRTSCMISIWSRTPFVIATKSKPHLASDQVEWLGDLYKVVGLKHWNQYGFNVATLTKL